MKKTLLLIVFILFSAEIFSQASSGLTYQSVIYDPELSSAEDNIYVPYVDKKVWIRFMIINSLGQKEYIERIGLYSDEFGMVNHVIGNPSDEIVEYQVDPLLPFDEIVWDGTDKSLRVDIDLNTGQYSLVSHTPLTYVPFAYYAANSASSLLSAGTDEGNTTYWDGTQWVSDSNHLYNDGSNVMIGTQEVEESSALTVSSDSKGILIPRLTLEERDGIDSPATGLLVFQTNSSPGFYYFDGTAWLNIGAGVSSGSSSGGSNNNTLIYTSDGF